MLVNISVNAFTLLTTSLDNHKHKMKEIIETTLYL